MFLLKKRTIESQLNLAQIKSQIENSRQFEGKVTNMEFELRESKFLSNKVSLPIIKGTIDTCDIGVKVTVSFTMSCRDKLGLSVFLLFGLTIAVLLGVISFDALLVGTILCFDAVFCVVFLISYIKNCRSAYSKIFNILKF